MKLVPLLCFLSLASAGWFAADEEPLPLSQDYRARLEKLCQVLDQGGTLPDSMLDKEQEIRNDCAKLRKNAAWSEPDEGTSIFSILIFCGMAYFAYQHYIKNQQPLNQPNQPRARPAPTAAPTVQDSRRVLPISEREKEEIRQARLRAFEKKN